MLNRIIPVLFCNYFDEGLMWFDLTLTCFEFFNRKSHRELNS